MDNKNSQKEHLIGYDEYDNSGKGLIKKRKLKQRLGMLAIIAIVVIVIALCLGFFFMTRVKKEQTKDDFRNGFSRNGGSFENNIVTASGTTSIGMNVVTSDIDYLEDTTLYIEEVYVSSNDEVEVGTKILKLTEDSIEAAKEELEETYETASLSYRMGVISTEQSKMSTKNDYDNVLLESQQAKQVYEDKIASLEAEYNSTLTKYNDAKEEYDEFNEQVMANSLEEYYDIPNLYKEYLDVKELYEYCYEKWEITQSDLTSTVSKQQLAFAKTERPYLILAIQEIKTLLDDTKEKYDEAQEKYNDALTNGDLNLRVLKSEMDSAKLSLDAAAISLEKNKLSAKTTYETALAKAQTAKNDYDTTITSLEESLDKLKDEMEDAKENLDHFNSTVGDGYLYTEESGTVMMVSVRKNESLAGNGMIMAYSIPTQITVAVSVSQDYISQIEVGEAATVMFSDDYGTFTGKVTSIDPVSNSNSRTSVTYNVTVELEGDVSALSANLTATVMFGSNMTSQPSGEMPSGERPSTMPSGGNRNGQ